MRYISAVEYYRGSPALSVLREWKPQIANKTACIIFHLFLLLTSKSHGCESQRSHSCSFVLYICIVSLWICLLTYFVHFKLPCIEEEFFLYTSSRTWSDIVKIDAPPHSLFIFLMVFLAPQV